MGIETDRKQVGWVCTYTPEELIHSSGFTPIRLLPVTEKSENGVEDLLPASICPFTRQVLANIRNGIYSNLEGIVIAHSCNAMLHLYNALKEGFGGFVYLLDLPRKQDQEAVSFFTEELEAFLSFLEGKDRPVNNETLAESIQLYNRKTNLIKELLDNFDGILDRHYYPGLYGMAEEAATVTPVDFIEKAMRILTKNGNARAENETVKPALLLSGGVPSRSLIEMLSSVTQIRLYPENCTGLRYLLRPPINISGRQNSGRKAMLAQVARNYLNKPACPRLLDYKARKSFYNHLFDDLEVKAVIYHDLMFCDLCHYDYLLIKDLLDQRGIPHLKVKTEMGQEDSGQLQTRVEAFLEIIQ